MIRSYGRMSLRGSGRQPLLRAAGILVVLSFARCAPPPPDVVDLSLVPQATQDAMVHVQILPLGMDAPPGVGSVGPVVAYGCGTSATAAAANAVQQLQAKALQLQATAVMGVMFAQAAPTGCQAPHAVTASGVALAQRGIPPSW